MIRDKFYELKLREFITDSRLFVKNFDETYSLLKNNKVTLIIEKRWVSVNNLDIDYDEISSFEELITNLDSNLKILLDKLS